MHIIPPPPSQPRNVCRMFDYPETNFHIHAQPNVKGIFCMWHNLRALSLHVCKAGGWKRRTDADDEWGERFQKSNIHVSHVLSITFATSTRRQVFPSSLAFSPATTTGEEEKKLFNLFQALFSAFSRWAGKFWLFALRNCDVCALVSLHCRLLWTGFVRHTHVNSIN